MNVLGHLLLAGESEALREGQFLGDFCRGAVEDFPFSREVLEGIRAHRRVDAAGDVHPFMRHCKQLLPREQRRYGGIVVDLLSDWLLRQHWQECGGSPWALWREEMEQFLSASQPHWPRSAQRFADFLLQYDMLEAYGDLDEISEVLLRLGRRLKRPVDLRPLLDVLLEHEASLHAGFPAYLEDMHRAAASPLKT